MAKCISCRKSPPLMKNSGIIGLLPRWLCTAKRKSQNHKRKDQRQQTQHPAPQTQRLPAKIQAAFARGMNLFTLEDQNTVNAG